jgi:putative phosphoribosyl transferase
MFSDRSEAGSLLAARLEKYQAQSCVILAVPNGGVPVAYATAKEMGMPLDILVTQKIGHPVNREQTIGVVGLTNFFIIPNGGISPSYISREIIAKREKLKETYGKLMGDKEPESLAGKTIILIDDGIITPNSLQVTVNMLRSENPAKIVLATPVASKSVIEKLSKTADEFIRLLTIEPFLGTGDFYKNFEAVDEDEMMYFLNKWKREMKKTG